MILSYNNSFSIFVTYTIIKLGDEILNFFVSFCNFYILYNLYIGALVNLVTLSYMSYLIEKI